VETASRAGRAVDEIELVAVTKTHPADKDPLGRFRHL
jgi:uncharacterized pyridoxal phosphate-containing UPF0001 family protein